MLTLVAADRTPRVAQTRLTRTCVPPSPARLVRARSLTLCGWRSIQPEFFASTDVKISDWPYRNFGQGFKPIMSTTVLVPVTRDLEDLLAALFRPDQLRRFLALEYGEKVARQLPGEQASAEAVTHEAALVLARNGQIDQDLFAALMRERTMARDDITRVALAFGVELRAAEIQRVIEGPVTLPDRVIQDTYDDLREQQRIVRAFLSGPWAQLNHARTRGDVDRQAVDAAGAACRAWATEHYRKVTLPEVREALEILRGTTLVNPMAGIGEFLLAALTAERWAPAIGVLERFSATSLADLWQIANRAGARGAHLQAPSPQGRAPR